MSKVFAVIGGQVFISQAVVEQAANAISKAVVMDCGTGELKLVDAPPSDVAEWLEKITSQLTVSPLGAQLISEVEKLPEIADPGLLEQIRKAAEEGAKGGYRAALEDLKQSEECKAQVISEISVRANSDNKLSQHIGILTSSIAKHHADSELTARVMHESSARSDQTAMSNEQQAQQCPAVKIGQTEDGMRYLSGIGVGISNEWAEQRAKAAEEAEQRLRRMEHQLLVLQASVQQQTAADVAIGQRLDLVEQALSFDTAKLGLAPLSD